MHRIPTFAAPWPSPERVARGELGRQERLSQTLLGSPPGHDQNDPRSRGDGRVRGIGNPAPQEDSGDRVAVERATPPHLWLDHRSGPSAWTGGREPEGANKPTSRADHQPFCSTRRGCLQGRRTLPSGELARFSLGRSAQGAVQTGSEPQSAHQRCRETDRRSGQRFNERSVSSRAVTVIGTGSRHDHPGVPPE